jgi:hypothetical protein
MVWEYVLWGLSLCLVLYVFWSIALEAYPEAISRGYEFVREPIPLAIIALVLGFIGVIYFGPLLLLAEIVLAIDYRRFNAAKGRKPSSSEYVVFCLISSLLLLVVYLAMNRTPASVLTMQAHMVGAYGPAAQYTQVDLTIGNPPEEAMQNLELVLNRESKAYIRNISELLGNDCKYEPINVIPDENSTFKGADGESRLAIGSEDIAEEHIKHFGSPQWKLECPRLGGNTVHKFRLDVRGDAENDHVHVAGTYERIASEESKVVKVNKNVPVEK